MLTKLGYLKQKRRTLSYDFIAFLPLPGHYVLRGRDGLSVWRPTTGAPVGSILMNGLELEFVRNIDGAYKVGDTPHNRVHCPNLIGCVFVNQPPFRAEVREL